MTVRRCLPAALVAALLIPAAAADAFIDVLYWTLADGTVKSLNLT